MTWRMPCLRDNYEAKRPVLGNARPSNSRWWRSTGDPRARGPGRPQPGVGVPAPMWEKLRRAEEQAGPPDSRCRSLYAKLALLHDLLQTTLFARRSLAGANAARSPPLVGEALARMDAHPLKREIITAASPTPLVNRGGITFAFRATERAFRADRAGLRDRARDFPVPRLSVSVEAPRQPGGHGRQTDLYLGCAGLLDRAVQWLVVVARGARPSTGSRALPPDHRQSGHRRFPTSAGQRARTFDHQYRRPRRARGS